MKILLLGSTGQVGQAITQRLPSHWDLVAPTREELDLARRSALADYLETCQPEGIINASAYTAVDRAETEQELAFALNAEAPQALAIYSAKKGARLIHYSTDYVFDGEGDSAWREGDTPCPLNAYGQSKLKGEQVVREADPRAIIFRTSWVYSTHGSNFVKTALRLASQQDAIRIVDDQIGAPTSAALIADVSIQAIHSLNLPGGIYHLSASGHTSWHGLASEIVALARNLLPERRWAPGGIHPIKSEQFPTPARRPKNSRLCCDKLDALLTGKRPDWREDLPEIVSQILTKDYQ